MTVYDRRAITQEQPDGREAWGKVTELPCRLQGHHSPRIQPGSSPNAVLLNLLWRLLSIKGAWGEGGGSSDTQLPSLNFFFSTFFLFIFGTERDRA